MLIPKPIVMDTGNRKQDYWRWAQELNEYYTYQYKHQEKECQLIHDTPEEDLPLLIGRITTEQAIKYFTDKLNGVYHGSKRLLVDSKGACT